MTTRTLYVPVLIETAEQAEALPPGTVALEHGDTGDVQGASLRVPGGWHLTGAADNDGSPVLYAHRYMVGDTALVPVEAEEETRPGLLLSGGDRPDIEYPGRRRYVTAWTEVDA